MSAKTYDQCVDRCEQMFRPKPGGEFSVGFTACLDECDERFAAGKEPAGTITPAPEVDDAIQD